MSGNHGRILLLPAETAPSFHLHDADALQWQVEQPGERVMDVVGTLHRSPDGDAVFSIGDGEHPVRLDVQLLLRPGLVLAFHNDRRAGESGVHIALRDGVALEDVVVAPDDLASCERFLDCKDRGQRLDLDGHPAACGIRPRAIFMRNQHDRLFRVIDDIGREVRLVVHDQFHDVRARDVCGGHDRVLVPVDGGIEPDPFEPAARDGTANGHAMKRAGRRNIVHIKRLSRDLCRPFLTQYRSADLRNAHSEILTCW